MKDQIFGEMTFSMGWRKTESLVLFSKVQEVAVVVSAYENETPNDAQKHAYTEFKEHMDVISEKAAKKIEEYMRKISEDICLNTGRNALPEDVFELLRLKNIMFFESGHYAFIFEAAWDDHGLAALVTPDSITVGPEDILVYEE